MKRFLALLLCVFGALASPMRAEVELSFDFYYDQLSPLGEWAEVDGYGYVWHPTGVDEDWAPYTDGYWSYTDAGWTWVSYEDWGGICYHYGRWTRIEDYGWCWVPGYEWGPAWVSWRKNDDYVGWAPLPPECDWEQDRGVGIWVDVNYDIGPRYYNFCRVRDFGAPVIRHVLFPRIRNVDICFSTVNITNISYNYDYGCVYNGGFDYDYIRARCERPVPALKLVQNTTNIYINNNGGNVVVNAPRGNALVVATPRLATNYRQYTRKPAALKSFKREAVTRGWAGVDQQETRQRLVSKMREETKGLTPTNAPARPVAKEALAVVPKQVDLESRPAGLKRATAERPSRTSAAVQVPVDPQAITTPSRNRRIEKMRPDSRGETAETPVTQPNNGPRGRSAETPRAAETPRSAETPVAGTDDNKAGGLRKRPDRPEGENTRPAVTGPANPVIEERGAEAGKPGRLPVPREGEPRGRVTGQDPATRPAPERMEQPERGPALRRPAGDENAARQAQENAERANAERQLKQREQAQSAQDAAERAQRQRNAQQQQNAERAAEMQRDAQAQENARAARENAMREQGNRARTEQAEAAQRQNAQREAAERAAAAQRERATEVQRERAMDAQRERAAAQQAEAQRERAAQQNEARQRAAEAQKERAMENQRAAAQAQQAEARQRAMEGQRERAAAQQAAQQNEARQRAMEAQRERAMENQRAAVQAQAQQRAAAQAQAQERAAAQAQAQAQAQQRAAAENAARRQPQPQQGDSEDPRKKKRGQ